jgi:hypothetical protein
MKRKGKLEKSAHSVEPRVRPNGQGDLAQRPCRRPEGRPPVRTTCSVLWSSHARVAMVVWLSTPTLAVRCSGDGGSSIAGVRGTHRVASRHRGLTMMVARRWGGGTRVAGGVRSTGRRLSIDDSPSGSLRHHGGGAGWGGARGDDTMGGKRKEGGGGSRHALKGWVCATAGEVEGRGPARRARWRRWRGGPDRWQRGGGGRRQAMHWSRGGRVRLTGGAGRHSTGRSGQTQVKTV